MLDLFKKKRPERRANDDPRLKAVASFAAHNIPAANYQEKISAEQAMSHPVTYRCLNKIATAVQTVKVDVRVKPGSNGSQAKAQAILEALQCPNDYMTGGQLRYWMALSFAAYGRIPFKVGRRATDGGTPNGIYPLRTDKFSTNVTSRGQITGYTFEVGSKKEQFKTRRDARSEDAKGNYPSYAAEIYKPNLGAEIIGKNNTPLNSLGVASDIINLLMRRAYDTASGHPNAKYIVLTDQTATYDEKQDIDDLVDDHAAGMEQSGNVLHMNGTNIQVEKLDNDLGDIHSKIPADDMARHIAGAFGVPVALLGLGAADGAKFASNYKESRTAFYEDTIIPEYLTPIAEGLTEALADDGLEVVFDHDSIPALQYAKAERAVKVSKIDFLDDNEKRELCGFKPRET
jgi:phage portal protein BeeE